LTLFCAYPQWLTQNDDGVSGFAAVCGAHSHVVAAAPPLPGADVVQRFPKSSSSPSAARRFVSDWLAQHGHGGLSEIAQLAVSELATNAVLHARSDFTVSLATSSDAIRIAVGDSSTDRPVARNVDDTASRGRGLAIVESLSLASGHEARSGGKVVWADIAIPHRDEVIAR
jgi:anti-sigma regulatory factor (Ser/Thr protein kinase)